MRTRSSVALATVAVAGALLVAGCGSSTSGGAPTGAASASPVAVDETVPAGTSLKIAEQFGTISLPLKLSGQQSSLGFTPSFANFVGGPAVTQALEAGAVDLGTLGDVPTVLPQASHSDLVAIAAQRNSGDTYGLVTAPGESITSIAGLKGKKIAYTEGTGPQGFLLAALKANGLTTKDVSLVNIADQKNVTAALQSHSVDAAALTDPIIPQYLAQNSSASLITRSKGYESGLTYLVTSTATLKNPAKVAAIGAFLKADIKAEQWVNTHQSAWVQAYYVKEQGLTTAVGNEVYETSGKVSFPTLSPALIAEQQKLADLLFDNGVIPDKLDATAEFDNRFNAVVTAAAGSS